MLSHNKKTTMTSDGVNNKLNALAKIIYKWLHVCVLHLLPGIHLLNSPPGSLRTAMTAPNSAERKVCWNSRDLLWKCLDDNGDKVECCQKFQREFEANCPAQWVSSSTPAVMWKDYAWAAVSNMWLLFFVCVFFQVKYFAKRRDFLKYKEKMETAGFTPAEGPGQPS